MKDNIYRQVSDALRKAGIFDLQIRINKTRMQIVKIHHDFVQPILSPQIIDTLHPFPICQTARYASCFIQNGRSSLGLIRPASLPTHIHLPDHRFVRIETILLRMLRYFRNISRKQHVIAVTRNADISFDEEKFDDDEDLDYRHHMSNY